MKIIHVIILMVLSILLGMSIGAGILIIHVPELSKSFKFKYVDLPEEINEVSCDINSPTLMEVYQYKDTLFTRFQPKLNH